MAESRPWTTKESQLVLSLYEEGKLKVREIMEIHDRTYRHRSKECIERHIRKNTGFRRHIMFSPEEIDWLCEHAWDGSMTKLSHDFYRYSGRMREGDRLRYVARKELERRRQETC